MMRNTSIYYIQRQRPILCMFVIISVATLLGVAPHTSHVFVAANRAVSMATVATPWASQSKKNYWRSRRLLSKQQEVARKSQCEEDYYAVTIPASTTTRRSSGRGSSKKKKKKAKTFVENEATTTTTSSSEAEIVTFDDLGPVGKFVAGATQIAFTTAIDYVSGFVTGGVVGFFVGVPLSFLRTMEPGIPLRWARSYGELQAVFGGCGTTVAVVRGFKDDRWSNVISSAMVGAYFERKKGPRAMLYGALLYGSLVYFFVGGLGRNRPLNQFTEQPLEY